MRPAQIMLKVSLLKLGQATEKYRIKMHKYILVYKYTTQINFRKQKCSYLSKISPKSPCKSLSCLFLCIFIWKQCWPIVEVFAVIRVPSRLKLIAQDHAVAVGDADLPVNGIFSLFWQQKTKKKRKLAALSGSICTSNGTTALHHVQFFATLRYFCVIFRPSVKRKGIIAK